MAQNEVDEWSQILGINDIAAVYSMGAGLLTHFGNLSSASSAMTASPNWLRRLGVLHKASATARRSWSASCSSAAGPNKRP